jgi:hypothetical protein
MCVKETLRMTAHNIGSVRKAKNDFELLSENNSFIIPKVLMEVFIGSMHLRDTT